jgi:hypothetical protein
MRTGKKIEADGEALETDIKFLATQRKACKYRKHSNNKGYRQIKNGKTREQVDQIAKRLNIPTFKVFKV